MTDAAPPDLEYTHYAPDGYKAPPATASARHLRAAPAIPPPLTGPERHDAEIAALRHRLTELERATAALSETTLRALTRQSRQLEELAQIVIRLTSGAGPQE